MPKRYVVSSLMAVCACGCLPRARTGARDCRAAAIAQKEVAAAAGRNEAAFRTALRNDRLSLVTLPYHVVRPASPPHTARAGTLEKRQRNGRTVTELSGNTGYTGCGAPVIWKFARGAQGTLYRIVREPHVVDRTTHRACGCMSYLDDCGGAAPPPVHVVYDLPAGVRYGGTQTVVYDIEEASIVHAGNPNGQPCPPPPRLP